MIEDGFVVIDCDTNDPEKPVATVRCKSCECRFEVHMFILGPKNCRHMLGESITVICPECKTEATTTEKESKIKVLEIERDKSKEIVDTYLENNEIKLRAKHVDWDTMVITVECVTCKHEFQSDPKNSLNGEHVPGRMVIKCPQCGSTDETDRMRAAERALICMEGLKLAEIEEALAELKGNKTDDEKV